jgi:hypothetical protein
MAIPSLSEKLPKWHFLIPSSVQVLILEEKLDYLNNPSQDFKKKIVEGFYESLVMLKGKIRVTPFF